MPKADLLADGRNPRARGWFRQLSDTVAFSLARVAGSIGGAGVATLAAAVLHPSQPWLAGVATAMAWVCYTSLRVNYGLFSFGVTAYVALLFAFAGLPKPIVALHRVIATATGGIIALAAQMTALRLTRLTGNGG